MRNGSYLVILNPVAAQGAAAAQIPFIEQALSALGINHTIVLTTHPGHARQLACEAADQNYDVVVAAGGDGTSNEVINGLSQAKDSGKNCPVMGLLPIGRGNDFAHGVRIPHDTQKAIDILAHEEPRPLDIGRITGGDYPQGTCFGNGIGIGFDTLVGLEAAKMKWLKSSFVYTVGAIKTLLKYPNAPDVSVKYNGTCIQQKSHQISIMNGQRMGGSFFMAPDALVDDGVLDMWMTESINRRQMLKLIDMYTTGTQTVSPLMKGGRSHRFEIQAPLGGLVCHADGETICTNGTYLLVECLKAQLKILRPGSPT